MSTSGQDFPEDTTTKFPRPKLPILPTMSLSIFARCADGDFGSVFLESGALFLPSGRAAFALALDRLHIARGDIVLLPAYHCQSMITPIHWAGAEPRFYNINRDLSPNLGDVERLLVPPVKALVLVHFFGFVQPAGKLRELCESRGVALIEDCAHAFIGRRSAGLPGNLARYSVASSRKFFPGADGGMLWAERDDFSDVRLESPSCLSQLKGIARSVQQAAEAGKLGWPSGFLSWTFGLLDRPGADSARSDRDPTVVGNEAQGDRHFDAAEVSRKGRAISRLFMRTTSINRMSRIRRRNYMAYVKGFSSMPHAKPLYPELDDAVVPYMFPLVIDDPGRNFAKLKNAGVPIWRWEDLSASDCSVSRGYLETLLQLPCHQELTTQDIDWIISRFGEICGDGDA